MRSQNCEPLMRRPMPRLHIELVRGTAVADRAYDRLTHAAGTYDAQFSNQISRRARRSLEENDPPRRNGKQSIARHLSGIHLKPRINLTWSSDRYRSITHQNPPARHYYIRNGNFFLFTTESEYVSNRHAFRISDLSQ